MVSLKLLVRVPMDCWRQWIRHRTASVNETSTRYSVAIDSAQSTRPDQWRRQAAGNRQGSEGFLDVQLGEVFSAEETALQEQARSVYQKRLDAGVAREQARKDLPLCTYTEAYWKINLHNLLHFLVLRTAVYAQGEIRQYAQTIGHEIVRPLFPLTWEAFEDYQLHALTLSRLEQAVIARLAAADKLPADEDAFLAAGDLAWQDRVRCRERDECREKLATLGLLKT
jgi:thymidylate synthase (FAD)